MRLAHCTKFVQGYTKHAKCFEHFVCYFQVFTFRFKAITQMSGFYSMFLYLLSPLGVFDCVWPFLLHVIHINHITWPRGPLAPLSASFFGDTRSFFFVSVGAFKQLSAFLVPRGTETPSDRRGGNFRNTLEVVYHTCEGWSRKCRLEENKRKKKKEAWCSFI